MTKRSSRFNAPHPPVAPREAQEIRQLGRRRIDAYAWMKFIPQEGTRTLDNVPPRLRTHLRAEMQYAQEVLQPLEEDMRRFRERMASQGPSSTPPMPAATGKWRYYSEIPAGGTHRVFFRTEAQGQPQRLLDEAERALGHAYYRATDHQPSPDDRYFVWAEDLVGNDRHRICVLDTLTGSIRTPVESGAFGYGGFTFSPSSRFLFWIWRDEHGRPTRLYRTPVDGNEAELIYEEHDPAIFMQVARTAAGGYATLTLAGPDTSEVWLIAAGAETAPLRLVQPRQRGLRYEMDEWDGKLLMLTNADGAFDRKLLCLNPQNLSVQSELVPHRPGVAIIALHPFASALIRLERNRGLHRLVTMRPDGQETVIAFDEPAYSIALGPSQPYDTRLVRFTHQTPASPPRWMEINLDDGHHHDIGETKPGGFDPAAYRLERFDVQASDGERVPLTVLSRADTPADEALPVLLTGYGAYGIAREPVFSWPAVALVDAGFRYAIAHVRGGSEKGWRWYQDGCREKKRNSMTDFIACAHHLLDIGYAAPGKIVAHGVSAGGLLVCGAMNLEPELWAGVIAQVPFVDMLNTMSDADHPLVPLLRPDWGDPLADPEAYDSIAALSPYENVRKASYPPLLCTAGLKDDRVPYWEPAKLLANLRHHNPDSQPAVLVLNPDSGHQESDNRNQEFESAALFWAFACRCAAVSVR
ncbi:Oligopeptidase B OS=Castellaniella defragrans OX=75697 GN=HNR28_002482 PE=4 SV=1 [Castellaniella defragrans]